MARRVRSIMIGVVSMIAFASCGGSSGSGGGSSSDEEAPAANTGAAVASVFSSGSSESISAELVRSAVNLARQVGDDEEQLEEGDGSDGPEGAGERDTCGDPDEDSMADGPEEISTPLTGTSGTYGDSANGNAITVDQDDFCVGNDGNENEGEGLYASFELQETITGTCTDDTTVSMTAGEGIWRNTDDCFPEVYGTFTMNGTELDCHFCMNENQSVSADSTCSSGGSAITLDSDVECTMSASGGEDEEDMDDEGEGGEQVGEDDEDTGGQGPAGEDDEDTQ